MSVVASIVANDIDRRREQERFGERMSVLVKRFEHDMLLPLEILHGLAGLFAASGHVTPEEFRAFGDPALERHPNVSGLFWVPRVKHLDREAFLADVHKTMPGFKLRERVDAEEPVGDRDEYHPIVYAVPERRRALGLDLSAVEHRRAWITETYERGLFVTPRVDLPTPDGTVAAVGAYVPVRKGGKDIGIVVASFRMARFVEAVFTEKELEGVHLSLFEDAADKSSLVYSTQPGPAPPEGETAVGQYERTFALGNRTWRVAFRGTERLGTRMPVAVTLVGTGLSLIVALLLFLVGRLRTLDAGAPRLGQYELLDQLGEGGMGTVYRARHMLLRRPTAVKVIRSHIAERGAMRERFEREVHAASELSHPNSIVVYDYGHTPDGELYYAMEYVDGIDLHRLVQRFGPQPSARVAHMLELVCGALAEAHDRGIVHRDIKPANIMLSRCGGLYDFPKVLDFGLALVRKPDEPAISIDGTMLGTPHFMAPEQGLGSSDLGPAADIYALGCVAYFLLSAHNLFEAPSVRELVGKHMTALPIPLSDLADQEVDTDLEEIVMQCLAKVPDDRPTAVDVARHVAQLARAWTNEDAAAWWRENEPDADTAPTTLGGNRVLTVRLEDRGPTLVSDTITRPGS